MPSTSNLPDVLVANGSPKPSSARLQSLYSFTTQQGFTNQTGYAANVKWWSSVIEIVVREGWLTPGEAAGERLSFRADEGLLRRLEWPEVGSPKGIGGVVSSMVNTGVLMPLSTFLAQPTPIRSNPSLAYRLVARPLLYGLSLVNPFAMTSDRTDPIEAESSLWKKVSTSGRGTTYVHIPLVEDAAVKMIAWWATNPPAVYSERVFSIETFKEIASVVLGDGEGGKHSISSSDCKVLLRYLQRDKGVVVGDAQSEVYKLVDPSNRSESVTEADKGTVTVTSTILKLERQIRAVEQDIEASKQKAALHIRQKQQPAALSYLRSKKQLEGVLDKRLGALEQLRTVLRGIDGAHSDIEVIRAYESSSSTLKSVLAHPSLQRDKVDSTLDALAEALSDQRELDTSIRMGQDVAIDAAGVGVDDDELERELRDLIAEGARLDFGDSAQTSQGHSVEEPEGEASTIVAPAPEGPSVGRAEPIAG